MVADAASTLLSHDGLVWHWEERGRRIRQEQPEGSTRRPVGVPGDAVLTIAAPSVCRDTRSCMGADCDHETDVDNLRDDELRALAPTERAVVEDYLGISIGPRDVVPGPDCLACSGTGRDCEDCRGVRTVSVRVREAQERDVALAETEPAPALAATGTDCPF